MTLPDERVYRENPGQDLGPDERHEVAVLLPDQVPPSAEDRAARIGSAIQAVNKDFLRKNLRR